MMPTAIFSNGALGARISCDGDQRDEFPLSWLAKRLSTPAALLHPHTIAIANQSDLESVNVVLTAGALPTLSNFERVMQAVNSNSSVCGSAPTSMLWRQLAYHVCPIY